MSAGKRWFAGLVTLLLGLSIALTSGRAASAPANDPAPPPLQLLHGIERRLPNGLRVVVFPSTRSPIVQIQLLVPAGAANEPDSLPGLANLTAQLLSQGTASRTAEQFQAELDRVGATFATSANRDYALAVCGVGAAHLETALELTADAALSAVFPDDAFEAGRRRAAQQLAQSQQDMGRLADDRVWGAAFGAHPYAHPAAGDIEALLASTPERARAFHREHWRPDRAVLAIAGDMTPERAFAVAEEWFGRWAGHAVPDSPRPALRADPRVRLMDLPGARYSEVRAAVLGPGRGSPEWPAWQVAATALGSGRVPAGAKVTLIPLHDASLLVIGGPAAADSTVAFAGRLREALRAFAAAPPSGEALAEARRTAAQAFPLDLETLGAQVSEWQAADFSGLPADALERTVHDLGSATGVPDLSAVARGIQAGVTLFVAGPGERLRHPLAALGSVEPLALERAPLVRSDSLPPATAEQHRLARAALAAAVALHGGRARIEAVHSIVQEGDMVLSGGGQELPGEFSLVRIDPDRLSFATRLLQFEARQVLVGDRGWSLTQADTASLTDLDTTSVRALRATLLGDLLHLLRDASAPTSDAALRGHESLEGRPCDQVDFRDRLGNRVRLILDARTHRVLATDAALGVDGAWHDRRKFSGYRLLGGILWPYVEERRVDGAQVSLFTTKTAAFDKAVDPSLFKRPRVIHGQLLRSE